jgi:hypothetical protein
VCDYGGVDCCVLYSALPSRAVLQRGLVIAWHLPVKGWIRPNSCCYVVYIYILRTIQSVVAWSYVQAKLSHGVHGILHARDWEEPAFIATCSSVIQCRFSIPPAVDLLTYCKWTIHRDLMSSSPTLDEAAPQIPSCFYPAINTIECECNGDL